MNRYLPGDRKDKLQEIIRVNHSGELGAINIYKGQIAATKHKKPRNKELIKTLNELYQGEIPHFEYFKSLMEQNKIRPSLFTTLWSVLGFGIGYLTALLGKETAMTLTVGVETIISQHYKEQLDLLDALSYEELKDKIAQFMEDEIEHLEIGVDNDAEKMCCHFYFNTFIKFLTTAAIYIAKRL